MLALTQFTGFNARRRTSGIVRGRGIAGITLGLAGAGTRHMVGAGTAGITLTPAAAGTVRTPLFGEGVAEITLGAVGAGTRRTTGAGTAGIVLGAAGAGTVVSPAASYAVAYWRFEESLGSDPREDATGNLFDLTTLAGGAGVITQETGLIDFATGLTGDKYLYTSDGDGSDSRIQTNDKMSLAGWFKVSEFVGAPDTMGIIYKGSDYVPANWEWGVYVDDDELVFTVLQDGPNPVSVSVPITGLEDTWIFFAAVADFIGNTIQISVNDGTPVSDALSGTYTVQNNQYRCGPSSVTLLTLDEIGRYNIALSAAQITELYNSGAGQTYP